MRLVNLDKENKNLYKIMLSKKDRKKLILGINRPVVLILLIIGVSFSILSVFFRDIYSWFIFLFKFQGLVIFFVTILIFTVLPSLFLYYKSVKTILRPFNLRRAVIDVFERKIYLKKKMFYFKDTDSIVFYLERKREKSKTFPKNNKKKKEGKDKSASDWVYYVKKKAFHRHNNEELGEQGALDNYFEEFIISPVEIKYLEDFSLVLGKEGLLGTWRQIAELLGVGFEENIDFDEKILLQSTGNAVSPRISMGSRMIEETPSLDKINADDNKMQEFLNLLRQKVEGKDALGGTSWSSTGFEEFVLFKEDLMGVGMFSTGFELRFWNGHSVFPDKEQIIGNDFFVVKELVKSLVLGLVVLLPAFTTIFLLGGVIKDKLLYLGGVFLYFYVVAMSFRGNINHASSKGFLLRVAYFLEYFSLFMIVVILAFTSLFENRIVFKILYLFVWCLGCFFVLFSVLIDLHDFSCPWDISVNRYASRLVFSFEDKILHGEHGLCVSRTHWEAPISKIQSLALLRKKNSLSGACELLLAIRIENDYLLLSLPCLEKNKIREILFFLQEVFHTLLAAFYSVNNMESTK